MTCEQVVERLPDDLDRDTARHLDSCLRCKAAFEQARTLRDALRPEDASQTDEAMLAEVRQRVLSRIGARPWKGWLRWAGAVGVAGVAAVALLWPARPDGPMPRPMILALPGPPDVVQIGRHATPPAPKPLAKPQTDAKPTVYLAASDGLDKDPSADLVLKLESSNPDVVLYWLMEPAGD